MSADADGHLVHHPHAGRRLARVEHFGLQPFELPDIDGRLRGHAAHALHDVEQDAFGLQQRHEPSLDIEGHVARSDAGPVVEQFLEPHLGIEPPQHDLGDLDTGQNALLFDEQLHTPPLVGGNARERRMVAVADIFADSQFDQIVHERPILFFHRFRYYSVKH